jgi:transposase-like protein
VAVVEVKCLFCGGLKVVKNGKSSSGEQRYSCRGENCGKTFQLTHIYKACHPEIKERMIDMALNGSGIRDTARVLSVGVSTIINNIKKKRAIYSR